MNTLNLSNVTIVGDVIFTHDCLLRVTNYTQGECPAEYNTRCLPSFDKLVASMKEVIKLRMKHCANELNKHINDNDVFINQFGARWNGGHFSSEIYKSMDEFIGLDDFTLTNEISNEYHLFYISAQQVIRHLYFADVNPDQKFGELTARELFNICSEMILIRQPQNF